jgi:hypothetical protein
MKLNSFLSFGNPNKKIGVIRPYSEMIKAVGTATGQCVSQGRVEVAVSVGERDQEVARLFDKASLPSSYGRYFFMQSLLANLIRSAQNPEEVSHRLASYEESLPKISPRLRQLAEASYDSLVMSMASTPQVRDVACDLMHGAMLAAALDEETTTAEISKLIMKVKGRETSFLPSFDPEKNEIHLRYLKKKRHEQPPTREEFDEWIRKAGYQQQT